MGYRIDEDNYQFDNKREMMASLGLDPDTIEGDYAEAFHHISKIWKNTKIDIEFRNN